MAAFMCKRKSVLINDIPLCCTIISKFSLLPLNFLLHWAASTFIHLHFYLILITASTAIVLICLWYLPDIPKGFVPTSECTNLISSCKTLFLCSPSKLEALQQRSWHTHEHMWAKTMHKIQSTLKPRTDFLTLLEEALNICDLPVISV